ncbi:MAG: hypothetical protein HBSAPP03_07940 [Phycisphaerae bacterium]|nr:MAG: hypothetical protein HBSAPP03_07940 [Phycisphaerae bacterium]
MNALFRTPNVRQWIVVLTIVGLVASAAVAAIIELTLNDFKLPGTKMAAVGPMAITSSSNCAWCHGDFDPEGDHTASWEGSLMGLGGHDPLFWAQMTTANQDVANAGYFCMKCHVPMTWVTGNALPPDGSALTSLDREGVACHFCHSMVDPIYREGTSPPEDQAILAGLEGVPPQYYANAMFVLDPTGTRRAARTNLEPLHEVIHSPFHKTGNFCGTCHEVGNVAVSRRPDGSYRYNAIDAPTPDTNPATQFPLERTYTEWRLSAFAAGGVDMGGRFGGTRGPVVSSCQDCHMPGIVGANTFFTNEHPDLAHHTFAGASAQMLDVIAAYTANDPSINQASIARGRARAVDMLRSAVTLSASQSLRTLTVRVVNESGHKLPTGHIEGRRVWVNVRLLAADGSLVYEYGHYDDAEAHLDESSTVVYEMLVGLSADAAQITGLPAGVTGRMALADTIEKDNRIPPRGFTNAIYEAEGAPVVGWTYADGQHWDEPRFVIPAGAVEAEVRVFYQQTPRHYIEMLRDNNTTNTWGQVLHQLWEQTGKGAPIEMAMVRLALGPTCSADVNCDGQENGLDLVAIEAAVGGDFADFCQEDADFNGDGAANGFDVEAVSEVLGGAACP